MTNIREEIENEIYNILFRKSKVYGVRVLYEDEWPLEDLRALVDKKMEEHISKKVLFDAIDQLMPEPEEINFKEDNYESGRRDALIDLQDLI